MKKKNNKLKANLVNSDFSIKGECAISLLLTKLDIINIELSMELDRNVIQMKTGRMKSYESTCKKMDRKGIEKTFSNALEKVNDLIGVRAVCSYMDDIYRIAEIFSEQKDVKIVKVKDYIKNPKPNGYRSYHMIVEIPVFFAKGKTPMRVELQIRTNGMDFWATLEHQLRYKKGIEEMPGYEEISEELLHSVRVVIEADNEMQRIKDKIGMFHEI